MRIAIDATVLWGRKRYSGVEKVVDRVVRRLLSEPGEDTFRVFMPLDWPGFEEDSNEPPDAATAGFIQRLPLRGSRRLVRIAWQQLALPLQLRQWHADVLISPAYVMPLLAPCPAVVMVHDLHGLHLDQTRLENWLHHRLFLPPTLRRAAAVLTPTQAVMDELAPAVPPRRPRFVAPLGVDAVFCPGPAAGEPRGRYLLFTGNLERRKGLDLLLEAFARLVEPGLRLVIAGKDRGSGKALRERAAGLGIEQRVEFTGYVEQTRLVELYRNAALLVHPALSEGFGIPPLEAVRCGTPVVAVETPAARETLGDAACLVGPGAEAIAAGVRRVLNDAAYRSALIRAGQERANAFTWERTTEAFRKAVRSVQAQRRD